MRLRGSTYRVTVDRRAVVVDAGRHQGLPGAAVVEADDGHLALQVRGAAFHPGGDVDAPHPLHSVQVQQRLLPAPKHPPSSLWRNPIRVGNPAALFRTIDSR